MSLFAEYYKEREGVEVIERDLGLITYKFLPNGYCYIIDVYVKPDCRESRHCFTLADEVVAIAKEAGCSWLVGSVEPTLANATVSLKVLLAYGFKVSHLDTARNLIMFIKEI